MTASTATAGYQGIFKISTVALTQIQSCELSVAGETYDVTVMDGTTSPAWKAFLAGLLSYTVKVTGFWDKVNDADQGTAWTDLTTGVSVTWSFSPNAATNTYSGTGIITSMPMKWAVNGAGTWEIDMQGTGALTYA